MNSIDLESLFSELHRQKENEEWVLCTELCKKALPEVSFEDFKDWYALRFNLASCLLKVKSPPSVDEAIDCLTNMLGKLPETSCEWMATCLSLGYAYGQKTSGPRTQNMRRSAEYFRYAQPGIDKGTDPLLWASIRTHLAAALTEIGDAKSRPEILAAVDDAEKVFAAHSCKEELAEVRQVLRNLERE